MADVNIQQTPPPAGDGRGSSGAVWAIVALVLLLVVGWLVFGGGLNRGGNNVDVDVNPPAADGGGTGGGGTGGGGTGGGGTGGGGTTTP